MARSFSLSLSVSVLASTLLGILCVGSWMSEPVQAAPRHSFPGRRIGGGTRGECAARQIVHLVPESSVFAPGSPALIGWLEGPSSDPLPLTAALRPVAADGSADAGAAPVLQKQVPAAANRLVLLSVPTVQQSLLWESSYRCDADEANDEFGFITASAPPALSLLVQQGDQGDRQLQQTLAGLQTSCGGTTLVAPLKAALQLGDDVIDDSWPKSVSVECF